ncbi:MAG: 50S ribosomal protein L11 [Caldivirga sp.]|jgi:large subunit ribosomal protein L11|uniref:50S ribosomal protein L11 n=1 Tax=Caldivirga sp. MU80 TaxID=1650354 RepID=UPI0009FDFEAE|nr:50S ribosomal protein L11 [Caldivirga sp. MU80]
MKRVIRIQTSGGKVPPQAMQQLQGAGLNAQEVANIINDKVKSVASLGFQNLNVEVEYDDSTRRVIKVNVEYPPITDILLKVAGKDTPSHQAGKEIIGDLPLEKVAEVALIKMEELGSRTFKAALKQVVSTCRSIGLTVNGKDPKAVVKEIDQGVYDELISKYEKGPTSG